MRDPRGRLREEKRGQAAESLQREEPRARPLLGGRTEITGEVFSLPLFRDLRSPTDVALPLLAGRYIESQTHTFSNAGKTREIKRIIPQK